jgi:hypothetical protein
MPKKKAPRPRSGRITKIHNTFGSKKVDIPVSEGDELILSGSWIDPTVSPRLKRNVSSDASGDKLRQQIVSCGGKEDLETLAVFNTVCEHLFQLNDKGWFIQLQGSRESLLIGTEKPSGDVGTKVRVTLEWVR